MKLYVANPTRMNRTLTYREQFTPGTSVARGDRYIRARRITIPRGKQVPLHGEIADEMTLNLLVHQLERLGGVDVSDMNSVGPRQRPIFLFSLGQPVDIRQIKRLYQHNQGVLLMEGQDRRKNAAIAADAALRDKLDIDGGTREPDGIDVEFEQLEEDEGSDTKPVAQGVKTNIHAEPAKGAAAPRAPRSRRSKA
jgi:hypothetical protein